MHESSTRVPDPRQHERLSHSAHRLLRVGLLVAAGLCFTLAVQAQQQSNANPGRVMQPSTTPMPAAVPPADSAFQQRRMRALNSERQKELVSDAGKLLKLVADLNAEVSHNKSDSFTPDQLRQLAKIEKLARSVREKMSNPVQMSVFGDGFMSPGIPPVGIQ